MVRRFVLFRAGFHSSSPVLCYQPAQVEGGQQWTPALEDQERILHQTKLVYRLERISAAPCGVPLPAQYPQKLYQRVRRSSPGNQFHIAYGHVFGMKSNC